MRRSQRLVASFGIGLRALAPALRLQSHLRFDPRTRSAARWKNLRAAAEALRAQRVLRRPGAPIPDGTAPCMWSPLSESMLAAALPLQLRGRVPLRPGQ